MINDEKKVNNDLKTAEKESTNNSTSSVDLAKKIDNAPNKVGLFPFSLCALLFLSSLVGILLYSVHIISGNIYIDSDAFYAFTGILAGSSLAVIIAGFQGMEREKKKKFGIIVSVLFVITVAITVPVCILLRPYGAQKIVYEVSGERIEQEVFNGEGFALEKIPFRIGYEFKGLYRDETLKELVVDENGKSVSEWKNTRKECKLYARWEAITVFAIINYVDEDYKAIALSQNKLYLGQQYYLSTPPEKVGWTFEGWMDNSGELFTNEEGYMKSKWTNSLDNFIVLKVKRSLINYNITYNDVDPSKNNNPTKYTIEDEIIAFNAPQKLGYEFKGWKDENGIIIDKQPIIPKGSTGDIVITANWDLHEYSISYMNVGDGLESARNAYNITTKYTLPIPQRLGYRFVGWTINGSLEKYLNYNIEDRVAAPTDLVCVANWDLLYKITYDLRGGFLPNRITEFTDKDTFTLDEPQNTGYSFAGWRENNIGALKKTITIPVGTTGDKSFTAYWSKSEKISYEMKATNAEDNSYGYKPGSSASDSGCVDELKNHPLFDLKLDGTLGENDGFYFEATEKKLSLYAIMLQNMSNLEFTRLSTTRATSVKLSDDPCVGVYNTGIDSNVGYGAIYVKVTYADESTSIHEGNNLFKDKKTDDVVKLFEIAPSKAISKIEFTMAYETDTHWEGAFWTSGELYVAWRIDKTISFIGIE